MQHSLIFKCSVKVKQAMIKATMYKRSKGSTAGYRHIQWLRSPPSENSSGLQLIIKMKELDMPLNLSALLPVYIYMPNVLGADLYPQCKHSVTTNTIFTGGNSLYEKTAVSNYQTFEVMHDWCGIHIKCLSCSASLNNSPAFPPEERKPYEGQLPW